MTDALVPVGYDPDFLGAPLPLPAPGTAAAETVTLPFTHFTVLFEPARRLALATGVNLDGSALLDLARGDDWHLDNRLPATQQTGPEVYTGNDLDRGHLVRRRDPVWGDAATAARANFETFTYVNAAPQAALFNQGENLWAGLEDYILDHASAYRQRLNVFTAPILAADDPPYRGVNIPRRFWKIAAWATHPDPGNGQTALAATGYVLDQTPQLDDIDLATERALLAGDPPPLGPFRTFQVPIADIATLTGLDLGPLPGADRYASSPSVPGEALTPSPAGSAGRWDLLSSHEDIHL
jgi:endonuclease G